MKLSVGSWAQSSDSERSVDRKLIVGIFLLSFALNVIAIQVPINPDEGTWVGNGILFIKRLFEGDFAKTFLLQHPGVTNMWLHGSSIGVYCWLQQWFAAVPVDQSPSLLACGQIDNGTHAFPLSFYTAVRIAQAIVTSGCLVALYLLARGLLGRPVALIGTGLLVLEPLFLSYQRLTVTDALQIDLSTVALFLLLLYLRGNRSGGTDRRLLLGSGVLMGLAAISKVPALFALPAVVAWVVLIELGAWRQSFAQRGWLHQAIDLALWGAALLVAILVAWPAAWADPLWTLQRMYGGLRAESGRGSLFFLGQLTQSPGPLFYPLVLAYRLSPVTQIGLLACLVTVLVPRWRRRLSHVPELAALGLLALFILLVISATASKIDRYVLPAFPPLACLAAVGWQQIALGLTSLWQRRNREGTSRGSVFQGPLAVLALLLVQLAVLVPHYPYYLTYFNPLLGGIRTAQNLLMVGQGEGLDVAANWLNQQPQAKEMTVASWYLPSFAPFFHGTSVSVDKQDSTDAPAWTQAQRVVLYVNQFQRQLPSPKMLGYFAAQSPLHTVRLHGVDYAQIYPGPVPLSDELAKLSIPSTAKFGNAVSLLGYEVSNPQVQAGQKWGISLYWQVLDTLPSEANLSLGLRTGSDQVIQEDKTGLVGGYLPTQQLSKGTVVRDVHWLIVPPETAIGPYQIAVEWVSPKQPLKVEGAIHPHSETRALVGTVEVIRS
ncbi:glycosyltransferase family 39 protein [Leptolyngbya sp. FACHB-261]|uniref:ArnT family glycosyltransferase n=1 Tax=Leptolyngbya sp. FACHB-261 TaxID=2692806 RepID=UPI00168524EC|nr:glycosyltransferase family 39 protein [Leptolyngbya sp. FACHB-261]MBD2103624.1 glycosyltransferase family 39 protein [Leptolyngbya sp. FACHB-261]